MSNSTPLSIPSPLSILGNLTVQNATSVSFPEGTLNSTALSTTNPLSANRSVHRHEYRFGITGAIAAQDIFVGPLLNDATIDRVELVVGTAPTTTDTITVDLQKWNGSAWASILSSTVVFNSSDTAMTRKTATISSGSVSATNSLKWVITRSGSSGSNLFGVARSAESGGV